MIYMLIIWLEQVEHEQGVFASDFDIILDPIKQNRKVNDQLFWRQTSYF